MRFTKYKVYQHKEGESIVLASPMDFSSKVDAINYATQLINTESIFKFRVTVVKVVTEYTTILDSSKGA